MTIGVGALSYAGQFNISVIADRDGYPDLDVFVASAEQDLARLADGSAVRRTKVATGSGPSSLPRARPVAEAEGTSG